MLDKQLKAILTQIFDPQVGRRTYFHDKNYFARKDLEQAIKQIRLVVDVERAVDGG